MFELLLAVKLHCHLMQVFGNSLFPSFEYQALTCFSICACHDLVQQKLILEVTNLCRITGPASHLVV